MRSRSERRKVLTFLMSKGTVLAGAAAIVLAFSAAAAAQNGGNSPLLSVFRRNVGVLSKMGATTALFPSGETRNEFFTGDFDADGTPDAGSFDRGSRLFVIRLSGDGSTLAASIPAFKGTPVVAAADYDGDGRTDPAVWASGNWHILLSSRGYSSDLAVFGISGDVPVPADFDGDARADLAVFRPSENRWYILSSKTGHVRTADLGTAGSDLLVPADYSGDGKADIAVYQGGVWTILDSETGEQETFEFGFADAVPAPGDLDRDGVAEFAVYRKGTWYVYDGSRLSSHKFGGEDDVPLSLAPVRESLPRR